MEARTIVACGTDSDLMLEELGRDEGVVALDALVVEAARRAGARAECGHATEGERQFWQQKADTREARGTQTH